MSTLTYDRRAERMDPGLLDEDWLRTQAWDLPTEPQAFLRLIVDKDTKETPKQAMARFLTYPAILAIPETLWEDLDELGLIP